MIVQILDPDTAIDMCINFTGTRQTVDDCQCLIVFFLGNFSMFNWTPRLHHHSFSYKPAIASKITR